MWAGVGGSRYIREGYAQYDGRKRPQDRSDANKFAL
jgi:hypothetical protein